jgi:DNA repair photolyase
LCEHTFVRWHEQIAAKERETRLPGFTDVVTRTFDAPESLNTSFHEIRSKSALNRVPGASKLPFGWTVNPYRGCLHACQFCFARPTHEYLGLDAGKDFEQQIIVKVNAPEVLRVELAKPSWGKEHVALGTNTDPYQWVEKRYRLTRAILEVLRNARNPCSVLTKSPLLLRDLDLFLELLEVTEFSACLSIPTLDEKAWRATEPHTPHPRKRLEAVQALNEAGVPTGVLVAPLMPGINDAPEQVEEVVAACQEAGAVRVGGQALFLRGATKDVFMGWLRHARPDLVPLYDDLYGNRAYLREPDKRRTEARLRQLTGREPSKAELAARFQRGAPLQRSGHGVVEKHPVRGAEPKAAVVQGSLF